jgi:hypothetical protein
MAQLLSTADIARICRCERWQVARLFESGDLPEPSTRIGGRRVIDKRQLPLVIDALAARGWLSGSIDLESELVASA